MLSEVTRLEGGSANSEQKVSFIYPYLILFSNKISFPFLVVNFDLCNVVISVQVILQNLLLKKPLLVG